MPDLRLTHPASEMCADIHCGPCGVDHIAVGAWRICHDCGHVYGSARELRKARRRMWAMGPGGRIAEFLRRLTAAPVRARDIHRCQECGCAFE